MKDLKGKNVLITGAASGIGRLMAIEFAGEGSNLALIDINTKQLDDLKKELSSTGVEVYTYKCDISDEKKVTETVQKIEQEMGNVDVLVNNAGVVTGKTFDQLTMKDFRRTMDINFFGHLVFTKLILPSMIKAKKGHIVNIASSAGLQGFPGAADYNASKFAEVGATEALRLELKKYGHGYIRTTLVCPYVIDTGMFKGFKPLLFNPILKPDYVVRKIMQGVKKEKAILKIPFTVNLTLMLKLFPVGFADWMLKVLGMTKAMDNYTGRGH